MTESDRTGDLTVTNLTPYDNTTRPHQQTHHIFDVAIKAMWAMLSEFRFSAIN